MIDSSNNKTSILINSQVPEFVRNEHATFVAFLEHYYKFLEQDGQMMYVSKNLPRFLDIDIISEDISNDLILGDDHQLREEGDYHSILQKMYDQYINLIPDSVIADKTLIAKHAKEFYRSTGSEKSVRFLLRALFGGDKNVTFYYPKSDVLKTSDGKWYIEKSLKITDVSVDNVANSLALSFFKNRTIRGLESNATATVESVDTYYDKGQLIYELKLSGIYREFKNAEKIFTYYTEEGNEYYLSANLFSGVIIAVTIVEGGSNYIEGSSVPIVSNGSGASVVISKVSKGSIKAAGVVYGGAGFRVADPLVISGSGSGASGIVSAVNADETYHPNTYNLVSSTIDLEANTQINNTTYSNLNSLIIDPANDTSGIANSMSYFVYGPCGPALSCQISSGGNNYQPPISITISSNTIVSKLGILGRMEIVNGGTGYAANDKIEFINKPGSLGSGAYANVVSVNATGSITSVKFISVPGFIIGGSGYSPSNLPLANVISGTGAGANVMVRATIGHNEQLIQSVSNIGTIEAMSLISGGTGYIDNPYLRLDLLGDGTANAILTTVAGAYIYPGRYINDDGHLSSYNFLEDRDYYQNYSYVVKTDESINDYRQAIKDLIHPGGMKLFGEYLNVDDQDTRTNTDVSISFADVVSDTKFFTTYYQVQDFVTGNMVPQVVEAPITAEIIPSFYSVNNANQAGSFLATGNQFLVYAPVHGYVKNDYVYFSIYSNASSNLVNGTYLITFANTNYLTVTNPYTVDSNTGNVRLYNPAVEISLPRSSSISVNDNIYLDFESPDPFLDDNLYTVYSKPTTRKVKVLHPLASESVYVIANSVNVHTNTTVITANNHGFTSGDLVYILINDGDTANISNGYYTITSVADANTLNIKSQNPITTTGNASVYTKNNSIVISNHAASNGNVVYVSFVSGDQGNTTNSVYSPIKISADEFRIFTNKPSTGNSGVRVWYSPNLYNNIQFTRAYNGFQPGSNVRIEFDSENISNGVYTVLNRYDAFSYSILYNANTSVNALSNTIVYSGLGVVGNIKMEGSSSVGLYK